MTDVVDLQIASVSIDDDAALARWLAVRNAVDVRPLSIASYRAELTAATGHRALLASLDGADAGVAEVGWGAIANESHTAFLIAWVLPGSRGHGVGAGLIGECVAFARGAGMVTGRSYALDGDGPSLHFAERYGLVVTGGGSVGALDLTPGQTTAAPIPDGIEITSLAERPDLEHECYELEELVRPEIPTMALEPRPSFEAWRSQVSGDPGFLPELSLIALRDGRVVGNLLMYDNAEGTAFIGMTAVHPDARRQGLARCLKTQLASRAAASGWRRIETYNDGSNERMRGLNVGLGYEYQPKHVNLKGPLPDG